jgi:hypothetical protein
MTIGGLEQFFNRLLVLLKAWDRKIFLFAVRSSPPVVKRTELALHSEKGPHCFTGH